MAFADDRDDQVPPGAAPPPPDAGARVDLPAPVSAPSPAPETGGGMPSREAVAAAAQEKPELVIAGAFVGAFLLARILKRIGGG